MIKSTPLRFLSNFTSFLFILTLTFMEGGCEKKRKIFQPVVAGQFYPSDPEELKRSIESYLNSATDIEVKGDVWGVIAPHAGYIYSGPVAGYSYRALKRENVETVIILAPSHRYPFRGASVLNFDYYRTPLGNAKIDRSLAKKLLRKEPFVEEIGAFTKEHSAEVHIPFIQVILPHAKILPVVMGRPDYSTIKDASEVISEILENGNGKYAFVVSTDLSHYHPYEEAREMDRNLLNKIALLKTGEIYDGVTEGVYEMCGFVPVITALMMAERLNLKPFVLHYKNSGDTAGGRERVVGYGAVAFLKKGTVEIKEGVESSEEETEWITGERLNDEEKKYLLKISRQTLEEYVRFRKIPQVQPPAENLRKKGAVFVTLKKKGVLRGCIGGLSAYEPLYLAVQHMTVNSCSKDPRFFPVTEDELKEIKIEISVLSPPVDVKEPLKEILIGRDGLIIEYGGRRGVLLPQVPVEYNWDIHTYLREICYKAGLPEDTWKKKEARLQRFSAVVFGEE